MPALAPKPLALSACLDTVVSVYAPESAAVAIAIHNLTTDSTVYEHNQHAPMVPASNMKLITTALALEEWNDTLALRIQRRLRRSRLPDHRLLADTLKLDSLRMDFPPGPPGYRFLAWTNHQSDNLLANWLLSDLRQRKRLPVQRLSEGYLAGCSIPAPGMLAVDGSGRSQGNRVAPVTFTMLLRHMHRSEHRDLFEQTLPMPGTNSTLVSRGLGLGHRVRAKTGYINRAFALSGHMSAETDTFAFSFMVNNCESGRKAYRLFTALLLALYHHTGGEWPARF